jgi:hypothetical protein
MIEGALKILTGTKMRLLLLLLVLPGVARAQFTFTTNDDQITITGYTGSGGAVVIPGSTNGYPVTIIGEYAFEEASLSSVTIPASVSSIDDYAFFLCTSLSSITIPASVTSIGYAAFANDPSLTSVTIPASVTSIGEDAFGGDTSLTSVTIPASVTSIGEETFDGCYSLSSVTIPASVTSIGPYAFIDCVSLSSVTIPASVTSIGEDAFSDCLSLKGVYFQGNSPSPNNDTSVFDGDNTGTVYYLPGTTGWGATFDGLLIAWWFLPYPTILNFEPDFGVQSNSFGFPISWATNSLVVVEACTNLANPDWQPVQTNTLTAGTANFSDPQWTNYPARFYRLRAP